MLCGNGSDLLGPLTFWRIATKVDDPGRWARFACCCLCDSINGLVLYVCEFEVVSELRMGFDAFEFSADGANVFLGDNIASRSE